MSFKAEPSAMEQALRANPAITSQFSPFTERLIDRAQILRVAHYAGSTMCQRTLEQYGDDLIDMIVADPQNYRLVVGEYQANLEAVQLAGIGESDWLLMIRLAVKQHMDKLTVRQSGDWQPVGYRITSSVKMKKAPRGSASSREEEVYKKLKDAPDQAESFAGGPHLRLDEVQVPHLRFEWTLVDTTRAGWLDPVASADPNRTGGALNRVSKSQNFEDLPRAMKLQHAAALIILADYARGAGSRAELKKWEGMSQKQRADVREFAAANMSAADIADLLGLREDLVVKVLAE